jgi:hypothetical protein
MRSRQIREARVPRLRVILVCVSLATVVLIAFGVLDLGGSYLRRVLARATIATEPALADVGELLPEGRSVPGAQSRVSPCVGPPSPLDAAKLLCRSRGKRLVAWPDHLRPRSLLWRETPPPTPLSDDPA